MANLTTLGCGRVYSSVMQRMTVALLFTACLALIGTQLSGVHTHVDAQGFDGPVQGTHEHHHDDGDTHNGDIDVQVIDFGIGTVKAVFLFFAVTLTLFLVPPSRGHLTFDRKARLPISRRLRWRPPLRAPPR